jgi:hypothetical protein
VDLGKKNLAPYIRGVSDKKSPIYTIYRSKNEPEIEASSRVGNSLSTNL